MRWKMLIIAGISMDIFAAMERQGINVGKMNKTVCAGDVLIAAWQMAYLFVGSYLSGLFDTVTP